MSGVLSAVIAMVQ